MSERYTNSERYNAGMFSTAGGGDLSWWHDYLRAELDRSHDFYSDIIDQQDAELTTLRAERKTIVNNIPMDYLQRHSPDGASGPTAETDVVAAMRDYAEDRWKLIDRLTTLRAENERLRGALTRSRDWFESQRKIISKGSGSPFEMLALYEERDAINAALQAGENE